MRREGAGNLLHIYWQQHICLDTWRSDLCKCVCLHTVFLAKPELKSNKDTFLFLFFISAFSALRMKVDIRQHRIPKDIMHELT